MTKRIIVGGASGLLGAALASTLRERGDTVIPLVRPGSRADAAGPGESLAWDPGSGTLDPESMRGADAVVVLNGVGIGDKRWNEERKRLIKASRVDSVATAAGAIATLGDDAPALIAASAIGIYGDRGDELLTEESAAGDDFLAEVCTAWEAAARPAVEAGVRVANMRTGIVLAAGGGALAPMLPLFKLGIGGRIGDGSQWWSWISEDDAAAGYVAAIDGAVSGPVNLVAPNPVTNAVFAKALGAALHRPAILPVPRIGLTIRLGTELAEAIAYASQRVVPTVLEEAGFRFSHRHLDDALAVVVA